MASQYQIWLSSPFGIRTAALPIELVTKLTYVRTVNAVGSLTIECVRSAIPESWVTEDARVEVFRQVAPGSAWVLEGDTPWLLSAVTKGVSKQNGKYWKLTAEPAITLLKRRHVLYYANSTNALYSAAAEAFLKALWYYNFQAGSTSPFNTVSGVGGRDWTSYFVIYQASLGLGPTVTKQFAWRNVLPIMQEVAKASFGLGTPMYFDIVQVGTLLDYRVYRGQRGIDRSTGVSKLVVSVERGSLGGTVESTIDWSDSASVVLAGGQGQDSARLVAGVADAAAVGRSPFGRREAWVDATALSTATGLASEAVGELRARRAKKVLTGDLISVPGAIYGLDWGHGDLLVAEFENESYTARVDSVTVTLDQGKEVVKAALRGELA